MCRLFIANRVAIREYDKRHNIGALLHHLERQCGGHGNGVALIKDGHVVEFLKGVNVKTEEIERVLMKDSYDVAIFHTRIASVGAIEDKRCHPFIYGQDVLAMNGTVGILSRPANAAGVTDTEIAFDLVKGRPLDYVLPVLESLNAVFVGVADGGQPYAVKNDGALEEWTGASKKGGFFFASSFPAVVAKVDALFPGFTFANGERTPRPTLKLPLLRTSVRTTACSLYEGIGYVYGSTTPNDGLKAFLHDDNEDDGGLYEDDYYTDDDLDRMINDAYEEGYRDGMAEGMQFSPCSNQERGVV